MSNNRVLAEQVIYVLNKHLSTETRVQVIQDIGLNEHKGLELLTLVMQAVRMHVHTKKTVDIIQRDMDNLVRGEFLW
ncbi:gp62 [Bacillus phage W.Ph.]|uniref:Gp62 n=1 Tax=Bacillus phage W.Ph. TaxID=764595 RepID=G9B1G3_9CAUD|nr:gp62 [Bacillus phage W.Ph.]ADH03208.1 gp62 [Bacillus phage W.Ph.]